MTAKDSLEDKTRGFAQGADDYITKPFVMEELILRIHAVAQRLPDYHPLSYHDIVIDDYHQTVYKANSKIHLTPTERRVLQCLMQHKGMTCPRATLLDDVR